MHPKLQIGNRYISKEQPTYIIAELSANHQQDFDIAAKTLKAMKEAGADAVKIQTYTPDSLTLDAEQEIFQTRKDTIWAGRKLYDLYKEAMTPWEWQPKLQQMAGELGMDFFSSPFDGAGVDFLAEMNVPAFKIASLEISDLPLIRKVARQGKPVILSTGVASLHDIELALNACYDEGNEQVVLLKCTTAYPAPAEEACLNHIRTLQQTFGKVTGLSDHTLGIEAPVAAVALGGRIIEKHFILDKSVGGPDASFSLDAKEFKQMVEAVRKTETMLGSAAYQLTPKMQASRRSMRSLIVTEDMKSGEPFTEKNVRPLRPGYGLHPVHYEKVLEMKARKSISRGTPLQWDLTTY